VGNIPTSRDRRGLASSFLLVAAAACTGGSDPNPREVRMRLESRGLLRQERSESAPAMVASMGVFPAPALETGPRQERQHEAQRAPAIVAVGRNAAHCVGTAMEQAFAAACPDLTGSFVACRDRDGVELLMTGRVDLALIGGRLSVREQQAGMRQTQLGVELFALAVAADFPVHSLTRVQVRQIFTGEITDWQQIGYDRGPIVPVVPADQELADRAAQALILGDNFTAAAIRVAGERHVADQILRNRGAIGVVRVTAAMEAGQKLLQIDWTAPTAEAFAYGTYPYGVPLQLVTGSQPTTAAQHFLQFMRSESGRELLGRTLLLP